MIFLKKFQIPSDGWVNWYFTPWNTDIYPPPLDMPDPDNFIHPPKASFHNTWYPWNVFENRFIPSDKIALCYGWKPTYNICNSKDIYPVKRMNFEGFQACVPNNPDAVLKAYYGDYMQIPPEEKRQVHSTIIKFYDE